MKRTSVQLAPGVRLLTLRTNQFKTNLFSVTLAVPLARETASANALIPEVLYRGTRRCPDIERLSAEADRPWRFWDADSRFVSDYKRSSRAR